MDNNEAEERNFAQVQLSDEEADEHEEMPQLEELSDHSSISEDYED